MLSFFLLFNTFSDLEKGNSDRDDHAVKRVHRSMDSSLIRLKKHRYKTNYL